MIKELNHKSELDIILNQNDESPALMRIKALLKAYGLGRSFIHFFSDEEGQIIICSENNHSILYLKNETKAAEASEFLNMTTNSVICEHKLPLFGFSEKSGNIYSFGGKLPWGELEVDSSLQSGYDVVSRVFSDSINSTTYNSWYADLSHRVRHGMSKIYTVRGKCSATMYCHENGRIMITQLATAPEFRNQGLARSLLGFCLEDNRPKNGLVLLSGDKKSDSFYEKLKFQKEGEWHSYKR